MKMQFEIDPDMFDQLMAQRLKEYMELCDPGNAKKEDRKFNINMQKHLRAVINYMSPPNEHI